MSANNTANDPAEQQIKRCSHCRVEKPHTDFAKNKTREDGLTRWCKDCKREYMQEYRQREGVREREMEYLTQYREDNKENLREYRKRYYKSRVKMLIKEKGIDKVREDWKKEKRDTYHKYKDRIRAYYKEWRKTPEGKASERRCSHTRRARLAAAPASLTAEQWEDIKAQYNYQCAYCGKHWYELNGVLEQEHVIPVSQGGGYTQWNIVPACRECNTKKGGRTPEQAGMMISGRCI